MEQDGDILVRVSWDESRHITGDHRRGNGTIIQRADDWTIFTVSAKGEPSEAHEFVRNFWKTHSAPGTVMFLLKKKRALLAHLICVRLVSEVMEN